MGVALTTTADVTAVVTDSRQRTEGYTGIRTTPMASRDRFRLPWMVAARLVAWSAIGCLS